MKRSFGRAVSCVSLMAALCVPDVADAAAVVFSAQLARGTSCCEVPANPRNIDASLRLQVDTSVVSHASNVFGTVYREIVPAYEIVLRGGELGPQDVVLADADAIPDPELGFLGFNGRYTISGELRPYRAGFIMFEGTGVIAALEAFPGALYELNYVELTLIDLVALPGLSESATAENFIAALTALDPRAHESWVGLGLQKIADIPSGDNPARLYFNGHISSVAAVPVPAALLLLAGGWCALFPLVARRRRRGHIVGGGRTRQRDAGAVSPCALTPV